jgi:hypothetical protein
MAESPSLRHADFIQSSFMARSFDRLAKSHKVAEGVDHTDLKRPRPSACRIGPGLVFCLLSKPRVQSGAGISLSIQNGDGFGVPGPSRSAGPVVAATQPLAQNTFLTLPNAALPGRLRLRN